MAIYQHFWTSLFATEMGDGGAEGDRTPDLDVANVALSQLSYGPVSCDYT